MKDKNNYENEFSQIIDALNDIAEYLQIIADALNPKAFETNVPIEPSKTEPLSAVAKAHTETGELQNIKL